MTTEELIGTAELHAGKRRLAVVVLGNALLLVLMLGVPWLRGYFRTRALWTAFARYGACLCGGEPRAEPGLGMPRGHEAYFATRALREPGFFTACDAQLSALAPDEAIFILPGLKTAEADLRGAVKLVRSELLPLSARTPGARLSTRPLRALERLRAGLANHTTATGIAAVPEGDAFSLPRDPALPTPARLPLYAGVNASVSLWGSDVELSALAIDATGISSVHLRAGKLEQTRAPRPKLLQAALPHEQPQSFVWAMSEARCHERVGGCADKALGVASVELPASALPVPRWLGAHPSGRLDRSFYREGSQILIAARTSSGETELREFELSGEAEASANADMPPLAATRTWDTRATGQTLILAEQRAPVVLSARTNDGQALLEQITPEGALAIATLPSKGAPWLVGCVASEGLGFAFGHGQGLLVGLKRGEQLTRWEPLELELTNVVVDERRERDRVQLACGYPEGLAAVVRDRRDRLHALRCLVGEPRCRVESIATAVKGFAVLAHERQLSVAYAGDGEASQVRVRSAPFVAEERGPEQVPAVCWSDARGLCGAPLLAYVGGRMLLGTREATDLMLLESADLGLTWQPLKGLGRRD